MRLLAAITSLAIFDISRAADSSRPCAQYAPDVSKLTTCSTASAFCHSYLNRIGGSVYYTRTFTATNTVSHPSTILTSTTIKTKTSTLKPPVTKTKTVSPTTTVTITSTEASCSTKKRQLGKRQASSSCGLAPDRAQSSVSGACNCILASSTTSTKQITAGGPGTRTYTSHIIDSTTITVRPTTTVTSTRPASTSTVCETCPQLSGNLVKNGNFESGLSPWAVFGAGSKPSDVYVTSPGAYDTSGHSVNITNTCHQKKCPNGVTAAISQTIDVCPNQSYILTFSYLLPPGNDIATLSVGYSITYDNTHATRDNTGGLLGAWNTLSLVQISGDHTESQFFEIYLAGSAFRYALLDDISIAPVLPGSPIIVNGDFESGSISPWWHHVEASNAFTPANPSAVTIASPGYNSKYAALLIAKSVDTPNNTFYSDSHLQTAYGAPSGKDYIFTFSYMRYPNSTGNGTLYVYPIVYGFPDHFFDAISLDSRGGDDHGGAVGKWNTLSYEVTMDDGLSGMDIYLSADPTGSVSDPTMNVAIDNISVVPKSGKR